MMKRLLSPLGMPLVLLILWLMLNDSLSAGTIALGAILATLLSLALSASKLRPVRAFPKHPLTILLLIWHVAVDITKSNIAVARLIWLGRRAGATPGFLKIPLRIRDLHGSVAGCIVTYTPGTVWSDYSEATTFSTLHVLDLKDGAKWFHTTATIRTPPDGDLRMNSLVYWAATFALGCFVVGLVFAALRLLRGPAATDRVLALDTMYINGMLILLVLGLQFGSALYSTLRY